MRVLAPASSHNYSRSSIQSDLLKFFSFLWNSVPFLIVGAQETQGFRNSFEGLWAVPTFLSGKAYFSLVSPTFLDSLICFLFFEVSPALIEITTSLKVHLTRWIFSVQSKPWWFKCIHLVLYRPCSLLLKLLGRNGFFWHSLSLPGHCWPFCYGTESERLIIWMYSSSTKNHLVSLKNLPLPTLQRPIARSLRMQRSFMWALRDEHLSLGCFLHCGDRGALGKLRSNRVCR